MPAIAIPKTWKRLLLSMLHALLMLGLVFILANQDLSVAPEETFIKWQSLIKNALTNDSRQKRDAAVQKALFVDVSNDKAKIWDKNTATDVLITDRSKLNKFFKLIKGSDYSYVLTDLIFDLPSPQDDSLKQSIADLNHIAFCIDDSIKSVIPILRGGTTSYSYQQGFIFSDLLLKFRLVNKTGQKSLPLIVYEDLYKVNFKGSGSMLSTNKNTFYSNNLTLDAHITLPDIIKDDGMSAIYTLGDLLSYLEISSLKERSDMLRGRIIVIGDFKNDNCKTAFGEIPGPLVLYNLYLNISHGNNKLTIGWIFFLFSAFSFLSYFIFYIKKSKEQTREKPVEKKTKPVFLALLLRLLKKLGFELTFIFLVATFSYLWFEKSIEIIALIFWINLLDFAIKTISLYLQFRTYPKATRGSFILYLFPNPEPQ